MKGISFFTRYTTQGPSSRYRHFQFFSRLLKYNYNLDINSFLDIEYLDRLYNGKRVSKWKVLFSYIKRIIDVILSGKNLVIEYELFPYLPFCFERALLGQRRYILNYDDDMWHNYKKKILLRKKHDNLVINADGVIAANDVLFRRVIALNHNTIKIPTVIDLDDYTERTAKFDQFTLVWIGTPVTYKYILSHKHVFQKLSEKLEYNLLIIASRALEKIKIENVSMTFYDWDPEQEVNLMNRSHIGIMPLDEDEFSKGKSAFKIIQYFACGLPVVVSGIGENKILIKNGVNGYQVNTDEEWLEKISEIYNDKDLYNSISNHNRGMAKEYSIQKYFSIYKEFLDKCFQPDK